MEKTIQRMGLLCKGICILAIFSFGFLTHAQTGWAPQGSTVTTTGSTIDINPVAGWSYVGYSTSGRLTNVLSGARGKVSCKCNTTGTCSPFSASGPKGTTQGCAGTCTNCTMTQAVQSGGSFIDMASGGYYSLSSQTRLLQDGEQAPEVFEALTQLDEYKNRVTDFYKKAYGSAPIVVPVIGSDGTASAPAGHSLVGILVLGRAFIGVVPDSFARAELGFTTTAKASCSCTKGSCKLEKYNIPLVGSATFCEGNCTGTCTLNTNSSGGTKYSLSLQAYKL